MGCWSNVFLPGVVRWVLVTMHDKRVLDTVGEGFDQPVNCQYWQISEKSFIFLLFLVRNWFQLMTIKGTDNMPHLFQLTKDRCPNSCLCVKQKIMCSNFGNWLELIQNAILHLQYFVTIHSRYNPWSELFIFAVFVQCGFSFWLPSSLLYKPHLSRQ